MHFIECNNCGNLKYKKLFEKASSQGEIFTIVKCKVCGLVQVNPQPSFEDVKKYYTDDYFVQRTDRGYDNYYSNHIRSEVERVFKMNLQDLQFFEWESGLGQEKNCIDIGCAAGYFVNYMKSRGWDSKGIEIAQGPIQFGREVLGLDIIEGDFLNWDRINENKYDLITLWASIEHLHKPKETLEKIYAHLKNSGRMILSTCRYGFLAKRNGIKWRYMNVPEHLYYYTLHGLIKQCEDIGFKYVKHITYGSGMTSRKDAGKIFEIKKKIMDKAVKWFDQGDMMAIHFEVKKS